LIEFLSLQLVDQRQNISRIPNPASAFFIKSIKSSNG
jgi:hypothetical protein